MPCTMTRLFESSENVYFMFMVLVEEWREVSIWVCNFPEYANSMFLNKMCYMYKSKSSSFANISSYCFSLILLIQIPISQYTSIIFWVI